MFNALLNLNGPSGPSGRGEGWVNSRGLRGSQRGRGRGRGRSISGATAEATATHKQAGRLDAAQPESHASGKSKAPAAAPVDKDEEAKEAVNPFAIAKVVAAAATAAEAPTAGAPAKAGKLPTHREKREAAARAKLAEAARRSGAQSRSYEEEREERAAQQMAPQRLSDALSGVKVWFNGSTGKYSVQTLRRLVLAHGGKLAYGPGGSGAGSGGATRVSHVVGTNTTAGKAQRLLTSSRLKAPVIHPDWVVACAKARRRVSTAPYIRTADETQRTLTGIASISGGAAATKRAQPASSRPHVTQPGRSARRDDAAVEGKPPKRARPGV